jgi:hypothetical protein
MDLSDSLTVPSITLLQTIFHHLSNEVFPEIVINTVYLIFRENMLKLEIESNRCPQIMTKRLLYHNTRLSSIETDRSETFGD